MPIGEPIMIGSRAIGIGRAFVGQHDGQQAGRAPPDQRPARHRTAHGQASSQPVRRTHRGAGVTRPGESRVLYVIVCGAGPAGEVGRLIELAHDPGWTVQIVATPAALAFIDVLKLEAQTGRPVRGEYRSPANPGPHGPTRSSSRPPPTTRSTSGPTP
jgi:hypothetical protein